MVNDGTLGDGKHNDGARNDGRAAVRMSCDLTCRMMASEARIASGGSGADEAFEHEATMADISCWEQG